MTYMQTFWCDLSGNMLVYLLCVACLLCVQDTRAQEDVALITVEYTIFNDLVKENFKNTITVSVKEGSTLLEVMQKAAELNPKDFSFAIGSSSLGNYVTSINHLGESTNEKTYWQYFSGTMPLEEGVGTYRPRGKEHIMAVFSKY